MNFLAAELKCWRSETLGEMALHLYRSLLKAYRFVLWGHRERLMNLQPLHGPITLLILSLSTSPVMLLVRWYVGLRVTPRKSRWPDREKKLCGIMCCFRWNLQLPSGRNLHFCDAAFRCILQPEASSKIVIILSTRRNSQRLVMAGLRSSQYAYRIYLVSIVGYTGGAGRVLSSHRTLD